MDANDNVKDGCEKTINENKCPYGTCNNFKVEPGQQCGDWRQLQCGRSGCCECLQRLPDGRCVGEDVWDVAADASCEDICEVKCNAMTENTTECMEKCNKFCQSQETDDTAVDGDGHF